ncbi:MAG: glycosyltransferase family 9 protein [Flavobacteriaceae bacterium]|nr:glycosyltransferase family 9 protein [Flavobacteriaceae bacterium]
MKPETKSISHLLVIRLSALGDVAMSVPVLRVLCATYPHLQVTVLSKPFHKPLFDELPNVTFYPAEIKSKHKSIAGLIKLARALENEGVDAVADIHNVLRSNIMDSYFKLKSIPVIKLDKGRAEKKALTREKNKIFKPVKSTIKRYTEVFEKLGFPIDMEQHQFPLKKEIPEKVIPLFDTTFKKHIGIAPFAAHSGKMYPLELMEEVIAGLDKEKQVQVFLFGGGKQEEEQLNTLAQKFNTVTNLAGTLSFDQELAMLANLDAMLAMDSGNAHLAAIYNVPTITIWGVTHPYAGFYPFGQPEENALLADRNLYPLIPTSIYGNRFPKGYENAMKTISPQQILDKLKKI